MEVKVNALMLRAADYNENDKILTLLTAEYGKLTAAAKGVKKATAKLKFAAQPFCFAEYVLAKSGDRYTVTGCTENGNFYDLRTDIMKFYAASAASEAAAALTFEGDDAHAIFYALLRAFTDMCSGDESFALIRFLTLALSQSGYAISFGNCPKCGKPLKNMDSFFFDIPSGAFVCGDCGVGARVSRVTYNVLLKASDRQYEEEYITPDGEKRALRLLREYFAEKVDARLPALSEFVRML